MRINFSQKYTNGQYECFKSDDEILGAIEHLYGDILDEDGEAYRVWAEPTETEIKKVEKLAWELFDQDKSNVPTPYLYWGETEVYRKGE